MKERSGTITIDLEFDYTDLNLKPKFRLALDSGRGGIFNSIGEMCAAFPGEKSAIINICRILLERATERPQTITRRQRELLRRAIQTTEAVLAYR